MDGDLALLKQYSDSGDAEALASLVTRYQDMVYAVCLRVHGDAEAAEESAQECIFQLMRRAGDVRSSLGGWLHRCATTVSLKAVRSRSDRAHHEREYARMRAAENDEVTWEDVAPHVDAALDELPDELRVALVERFLRRRTQTAIAEEAGVSVATVSRRVDKALGQLRTSLKRMGVLASAAALAGMLSTKTAVAAPAALTAAFGKMAISGVGAGTGAGAASATGLGASGLAKAAVLVALAAAVGAAVVLPARPEPEAAEAPAQAAQAPAPVPQAPPTSIEDMALPEGARLRLGTRLFRAEGMVQSLAFSPDGRVLAGAADHGPAVLWDAATGAKIGELRGDFRSVGSLVFSRDGGRIITGGGGSAVGYGVWTAPFRDGRSSSPRPNRTSRPSRSRQTRRRRRRRATKVSCSGKRTPARNCGVPRCPSWTRGVSLFRLTVAWWPCRIPGGTFRIWRVGSDKPHVEVSARGSSNGALVFAPDGSTLFSGGRAVCAWDAATGELRRDLNAAGEGGNTLALVFTPDGKQLVTGQADGAIHFWDPATGHLLRTLWGSGAGSLAFSPDGRRLAAGGRGNIVQMWDVEAGEMLVTGDGHEWQVWAATFSPDGGLIATSDNAGPIRVWDAQTGARVGTLPSDGPTSYELHYSPDGRMVAVIGWRPCVRLFDAESGRTLFQTAVIPRAEWRAPGYNVQARPATFSPDGSLLAVAHYDTRPPFQKTPGEPDAYIALFDTTEPREVRRISGLVGRIMSLSFSADGTRLASAGEDRTARIWDVATGRELAKFEIADESRRFDLPNGDWAWTGGMIDAAVSLPADAVVARTSEYVLVIRRLGTGEELKRVQLGNVNRRAFAFSADGTLLAMVTGVHPATTNPATPGLSVFDTRTWRRLAFFDLTDESDATCITFSRDGRSIVTGMTDTTVLVWDVAGVRDSAGVELPTPKEGGDDQLRIYWRLVEPGMAARRVFWDEDGVVYKAILYRLRDDLDPPPAPPYTEAMLAPWRIVLLEYDDEGRLVRWRQYTPEDELVETTEFCTYDADGKRTANIVEPAAP